MSTTRECGDCSLCCKLTYIKFGPDDDKPANEWCKQCVPGLGCRIYDERPDTCDRFSCAWLTDESWPVEHKPRACGCVVKCEVTVDGQPYVRVLEDVQGASQNIDRELMRLSMAGLPIQITSPSEYLRAVVWDRDGLRHTAHTDDEHTGRTPMISSDVFHDSFMGNINTLREEAMI